MVMSEAAPSTIAASTTCPLPERADLHERGGDAEGEQHPAAAEVADQVQRRDRPLPRPPDGPQGAPDGDVVDVVPGRTGPRAVLAPAGHPAVDEARVRGPGRRRARGPCRSATPGRKPSTQRVGRSPPGRGPAPTPPGRFRSTPIEVRLRRRRSEPTVPRPDAAPAGRVMRSTSAPASASSIDAVGHRADAAQLDDPSHPPAVRSWVDGARSGRGRSNRVGCGRLRRVATHRGGPPRPRPRSGQPDRRPHRLQRRAGAPDGDRARGRGRCTGRPTPARSWSRTDLDRGPRGDSRSTARRTASPAGARLAAAHRDPRGRPSRGGAVEVDLGSPGRSGALLQRRVRGRPGAGPRRPRRAPIAIARPLSASRGTPSASRWA